MVVCAGRSGVLGGWSRDSLGGDVVNEVVCRLDRWLAVSLPHGPSVRCSSSPSIGTWISCLRLTRQIVRGAGTIPLPDRSCTRAWTSMPTQPSPMRALLKRPQLPLVVHAIAESRTLMVCNFMQAAYKPCK
jgi:hypothetical protein